MKAHWQCLKCGGADVTYSAPAAGSMRLVQRGDDIADHEVSVDNVEIDGATKLECDTDGCGNQWPNGTEPRQAAFMLCE